MTIIDTSAGSESSWIEWTEPVSGTDNVSRVDPFRIKFTKILDPLCLNSNVIKLFDDNGSEVISAFLPISIGNDWDPIAKIVELRLSAELAPETGYTLTIDGLYDAIGDSQDQPHTFSFITNANSDTFVLDVSGPSQITVVDHTISNAELVSAPLPTGAHSIFMNPVDKSYNVPSTTSTLHIIFSPADVQVASATVARRPVSTMDEPWETLPVDTDLVDAGHLDITLPLSGSSYVSDGYEYQVSVTVGSELAEFHFAGDLTPMLANVQTVLISSPRLDSFLVARNIYTDSQYVISIDSTMASTPTRAASDFVLYNTLATLNPIDTVKSYSLADISISRKSSLQERWAKLAADALKKLQGGPRSLVKGSAHTSPHAKRDFGSSVTRIGK